MPVQNALGRRVPTDFDHVAAFPFGAVAPEAVPHVERTLKVPNYRLVYDQGDRSACVGYASSWMMSILNRRRYQPLWLWDRAKERDEWSDTNPGDNQGTSVRAAMSVLRTIGHVRVVRGKDWPPSLTEGILEDRWATTVDQVRTALAGGTPVVLGINWYAKFDEPMQKGPDWWVGDGDLGEVRGGHAVCVIRASDRREAVGFVNNWGERYPALVHIPYPVLGRLISEDGEAALVTDLP
jgi:hypothetical protein